MADNTYYNLKQWLPGDRPRRDEVNAAVQGIGAAIKSVQDAGTAADTAIRGELATAQAALGTLGTAKAEIVTGGYRGNGTEDRQITLGFRPVAIFVEAENGGRQESSVQGGLALDGSPVRSDGRGEGVTINDKGFILCRNKGQNPLVNQSNLYYYYLAFRR